MSPATRSPGCSRPTRRPSRACSARKAHRSACTSAAETTRAAGSPRAATTRLPSGCSARSPSTGFCSSSTTTRQAGIRAAALRAPGKGRRPRPGEHEDAAVRGRRRGRGADRRGPRSTSTSTTWRSARSAASRRWPRAGTSSRSRTSSASSGSWRTRRSPRGGSKGNREGCPHRRHQDHILLSSAQVFEIPHRTGQLPGQVSRSDSILRAAWSTAFAYRWSNDERTESFSRWERASVGARPVPDEQRAIAAARASSDALIRTPGPEGP